MKITRRSFLAAAAITPISALASVSVDNRHIYHYDHVLGTSMDLAIWSRDPAVAESAHAAIVAEILRLNSVLNTRDSASEIRRFDDAPGGARSRDLHLIFLAYDHWEKRTGGLISIRPAGPESDLNVDALGKAYIIDRAVAAARLAAPSMDGLLLNIGGDIVTWGHAQDIHIADPRFPQDNAPPFAAISLRNAAVATSGNYARGSHLRNARNGQLCEQGVSATVVAPTAVIANSLATSLCVTNAVEGLRLVESTPGAEALRIDPSGGVHRTSGFARLERPRLIRTAMAADWPEGFELTIALTMLAGQSAFGGGGGGGRGGFGGGPFGGRGLPPQFVAVWVENTAGKLVRVLAFWANGKLQYYRELATFFTLMGQNANQMYSMARATRKPGSYSLVWDGLDEQHKPVPPGSYKIVVETNQEHGSYGKRDGAIVCADAPATLTLPMTANFDPVLIQYGPRQKQA